MVSSELERELSRDTHVSYKEGRRLGLGAKAEVEETWKRCAHFVTDYKEICLCLGFLF